MTRWLVVVEGDIEPRLEGPFKSEQNGGRRCSRKS